jgi:hypothetical protein
MRTLFLAIALLSFASLSAQPACVGAIGSDVDRDGVDDYCDASYLPPFAAPNPNPGYGARRILVAHFKFPDYAATYSVEDTRLRLTGAQPFSVSQFYAEISYGAATQTYDIRPWVDLPHERAYYQTNDPNGLRLVSDALAYVGSHYDLQNVDVVVLNVMPLDFDFPGKYAFLPPGIPIGDSGYIKPVAVLTGFDTYSISASHEIGHTYGFLHTSEILCRTWTLGIPFTWTDPFYNDRPCEIFPNRPDAILYGYAGYDMMGNLTGHPNAFLKTQAGWLKPQQLVQAPAGGSFEIDSYEVASPGVKAIQVPYGADTDGKPVSLWIEYRAKPLMDLESHAIRTAWPNDRVLIWVNLPSVLSAPSSTSFNFNTTGTPSQQPEGMRLPADTTFSDPYRGYRVTRGADTNFGGVRRAPVTVEMSRLTFDPNIGLKLGPQDVRFVRVTNGNDSVVTFGAVQVQGRSPSTFRIVADTCSGATLQPGAECRVSVTQDRSDGSFGLAYAHLAFSTNDPLWPSPMIGLVGNTGLTYSFPPEAPAIGTPVAGEGAVTVFFTPRSIGGGTLLQYTALCNSGQPVSGTSSPIVVHGLTAGVPTQCVVKATSTVGDSAWSAASKSVTPHYGPRRRSTRS